MDFKEFLIQKGVEDGLKRVILSLVSAFPTVARMLSGQTGGQAGTKNVFGESQLAIDVEANNLFLEILKTSGDIASIASEELEAEEKGMWSGGNTDFGAEGVVRGPISPTAGDTYSVAFDPLDGSSLVDVNLSVGSIFGIYKGAGFIGRTGAEQVAAIIAVYGPRLTFMVTLGSGVFEFLYDGATKKFALSGEIKLTGEKKIFAPGNLRACVSEAWYMKLLEFWSKNGYTLRYSGGMVPDVNHILKKGSGVFSYPGYKEKPEGKLRLLYECAPMAFLAEQAGGAAVVGGKSSGGAEQGGMKRILDLKIEKLDQRTPIFLGSKKEVEMALSFMK